MFYFRMGMFMGMAADCLLPLRVVMVVMLLRVKMGMDVRHGIMMMQMAVGFPEQQVNGTREYDQRNPLKPRKSIPQ